MEGLLAFLALIVVFVLVVRHLRKREMEAFRGEDMSALRDFTPTRKRDDEGTGPIVDVDELTARYPDAVRKIEEATSQGYELRVTVLDEIHRNVFEILHSLIPDGYRLLYQVPLSSFIKSTDNDFQMTGKSVPFLVCDAEDYSVVFAVVLRGAGATEAARLDFITKVFREIEKPLIVLPLAGNVSVDEVKAELAGLVEN